MVTMKDVAKHAGVSTYTVSNVINNLSYIKKETKEKVLEAIKELNYKPNYAGQLLRTKDNRNISVSLPLLTGSRTGNAFFNQILLALYVELNMNNYNLVLSFSDNNPQTDILNFSKYNNNMIAGMICTFTLSDIEFLNNLNYPIIALDHKPEEFACDYISTDNKQITEQAVQYLITSGYTKIGYIGANYSSEYQSNHFERLQGYLDALEKNHLAQKAEYIHSINLGLNDDVAEGYRAAECICKTGVNAVIIDNAYSAIGFYKYINETKLRIPQDVAIIAFDDYEWQEISDPPLSVIRQPTAEIGQKAVELLLSRIDNPDKEYEHIILPSSLIIRDSV